MTLIDTTDSVLMLGAYRWAFVKPIRKLYYNLTITAVSVIVAVVVGSGAASPHQSPRFCSRGSVFVTSAEKSARRPTRGDRTRREKLSRNLS